MKNRLLAILTLVSLGACSTTSLPLERLPVAAARLDSPESTGGSVFGGKVGARIGFGAAQIQRASLSSGNIFIVDGVPAVDPSWRSTVTGELGLWERIDFGVVATQAVPILWRLKFQAKGDARDVAKAGNTSASITLGYGRMSATEDTSSWTTNLYDFGVIVGYRPLDLLLLYGGSSVALHGTNATGTNGTKQSSNAMNVGLNGGVELNPLPPLFVRGEISGQWYSFGFEHPAGLYFGLLAGVQL